MNTWALAELVPRRLIPFSVNIWGLLSEPEWVNVNTYVEVMYTMLCFFVGSSLGRLDFASSTTERTRLAIKEWKGLSIFPSDGIWRTILMSRIYWPYISVARNSIVRNSMKGPFNASPRSEPAHDSPDISSHYFLSRSTGMQSLLL